MVETNLSYEREPDDIAKLKMKPISMPNLGHLQMLPIGTEIILIDLEAQEAGETAVHGIEMDERLMKQVTDDIAKNGADFWIGYECLIYCLPDGYEGPLS